MVILPGILGSAQNISFETDLVIINRSLSKKKPDPYKRDYIYKNESSLFKKMNPINVVFGGALFFYQNYLSSQISSGCLYSPSCSEFSKEVLREYGLAKGIILSADRIHRCNGLVAVDLRTHKKDPETKRYPDPASRYKKLKINASRN